MSACQLVKHDNENIETSCDDQKYLFKVTICLCMRINPELNFSLPGLTKTLKDLLPIFIFKQVLFSNKNWFYFTTFAYVCFMPCYKENHCSVLNIFKYLIKFLHLMKEKLHVCTVYSTFMTNFTKVLFLGKHLGTKLLFVFFFNFISEQRIICLLVQSSKKLPSYNSYLKRNNIIKMIQAFVDYLIQDFS